MKHAIMYCLENMAFERLPSFYLIMTLILQQKAVLNFAIVLFRKVLFLSLTIFFHTRAMKKKVCAGHF